MKKIFSALLLFALFLEACQHEKEEKNYADFLKQASINALAVDGVGHLWVGTDTGLFRQNGEEFNQFDLASTSQISSLTYESGSNLLWVGTSEGLFKISMGQGSKVEQIESDKLSNNFILSAFIDSSSRWFASTSGISRNSGDSWQKEKFKKNFSGTITPLPFEKSRVNSIARYEGDYFFATSGLRLYRTFNWNEDLDAFSGATQWQSPYNGQAISDTVFVVFIDSKGQQWFGGKDGVQVHEGHDPKALNTSFYDEIVNPRVHCIAESSSGEIWIGTEAGISIFDGSSWRASSINLPDPFVTAITFRGNGTMYIGTKKGLISAVPGLPAN